MKKLLTLVLVCGALNAYEIKFDKSFEKSILPNILSTNISVISEMENELKVSENLDKFNNFFKALKNVNAKNGILSINPQYKYHEDKAKCVGYYGSLSYEIKAKSAKDMNEFIKDFLSFKQKINSDIKTNISHVVWKIGKKPYQKAVEKLRLEALIWVKAYIKELENSLKSTCKLKQVIFDNSPIYSPRNNVNSYMEKTSFISKSLTANATPMRSSDDITINPNFTIECE